MSAYVPYDELPDSLRDLISLLPITAILHRAADGGFWVDSPKLPGCFASGDTIEEAGERFKLAMFEYFDIPRAYHNPANLGFESTRLTDSRSKSALGPVTLRAPRDLQLA